MAYVSDTPQQRKVKRYLGSPLLKRSFERIDFTQEQLEEYIKCSQDPIYFIRTYLKIVHVEKGKINFDMYPFQEKMVEVMSKNRFSIFKLPRQVGKSTVAAAFILWYVTFHRDKTVGLLANKGELAQEILGRLQVAYEHMPLWMQPGVETWNKRSIELDNGSRVLASASSSSAARGQSFSMLYLDEVAFIQSTQWEEFYKSVYPTVASGKDTKIIMTSTPNGLNHYWKLWEDSISGRSEYANFEINWWDVPGRDEKWKAQQIANTSEEQFEQEFNCSFLGSSATLISAKKLAAIPIETPKKTTEDGVRIYKMPEKGRDYMLVADTARGLQLDYSAFTIWDISESPYELAAVYRCNSIPPLTFSWLIAYWATEFNEAWVLCELNDAGEQVSDDLHHTHEYDKLIETTADKKTGGTKTTLGARTRRGVTTSRAVKQRGCAMLKSLVERDQLLFRDDELIQECTHFVRKDGSIQNVYAAEEGFHDDMVMTAVLFSWATTQQFFKDLTDTDVSWSLAKKLHQQKHDSTLPDIISEELDANHKFQDLGDGEAWMSDSDYMKLQSGQFFKY